jgi:hypothetical protein
VSAFPESAVHAGSRRCENRCGYRITQCMLERGGVNGREVRECTRELVAACRASRRVCPLPTAGAVVSALAEVEIMEATVHDPSLCATVVRDVPVSNVDEAILVGRDTAAALANVTDPTLEASSVHRGGVFEQSFVAGTNGHGAAFVPLGHAIVAMTRRTRAVTYVTGDGTSVAYGVIGMADGNALGLLLAFCPE